MSSETAEALGLVEGGGFREVTLEAGVVLTMRPPEAKDWVVARDEVAKVVAADKVLTAASQRYGWSGRDKLALAAPGVSERVARWCVLVELAPLIVSEVSREHEGERRSVEPTVEAFRFLFKLGDNFDRFDVEARKAELELIQPKKG
jgi:hypothetical protein